MSVATRQLNVLLGVLLIAAVAVVWTSKHVAVAVTSALSLAAVPNCTERTVVVHNVTERPVVVNCTTQAPDPITRCVRLRSGKGGSGLIGNDSVTVLRENRQLGFHDVWNDLQAFRALSEAELSMRLRRERQFHFEGEHAWWAPTSVRELAWYYRTSVSYLFANAIHSDVTQNMRLTVSDGPVLDYSGGVGNNIIGLALRNIPSVYFGIGMLEMNFARYRVRNRRLEHLVTFLEPYRWGNMTGRLIFDPQTSVPDMQFGVILVIDVLEHIPDYHLTLAHLISVLRPGGIIIENTPFGSEDDELAIHQKASMPIEQAMVGMRRALQHERRSNLGVEWIKL